MGQGRKGISQAGVCIAVEVPFATEASPSGEDGEGDDLAGTERRIGSRMLLCLRAGVAEWNYQLRSRAIREPTRTSCASPAISRNKSVWESLSHPQSRDLCASHAAGILVKRPEKRTEAESQTIQRLKRVHRVTERCCSLLEEFADSLGGALPGTASRQAYRRAQSVLSLRC